MRILALVLLAAFELGSTPVSAQQIHGTPGAPDATVTLEGKQLPPSPFKFGGKIGEVAKESKPYWRPASFRPRARRTCFSS